MKIDLAFTPFELEKKELEGKAVVVIDSLRATSTMLTAFENGCAGFIPVATIEEARELAANLKDPNILLGGERGARALEGFQVGNSPRDYSPEKVRGKVVIMTTTNGTRALVAARRGGGGFHRSLFEPFRGLPPPQGIRPGCDHRLFRRKEFVLS